MSNAVKRKPIRVRSYQSVHEFRNEEANNYNHSYCNPKFNAFSQIKLLLVNQHIYGYVRNRFNEFYDIMI